MSNAEEDSMENEEYLSENEEVVNEIGHGKKSKLENLATSTDELKFYSDRENSPAASKAHSSPFKHGVEDDYYIEQAEFEIESFDFESYAPGFQKTSTDIVQKDDRSSSSVRTCSWDDSADNVQLTSNKLQTSAVEKSSEHGNNENPKAKIRTISDLEKCPSTFMCSVDLDSYSHEKDDCDSFIDGKEIKRQIKTIDNNNSSNRKCSTPFMPSIVEDGSECKSDEISKEFASIDDMDLDGTNSSCPIISRDVSSSIVSDMKNDSSSKDENNSDKFYIPNDQIVSKDSTKSMKDFLRQDKQINFDNSDNNMIDQLLPISTEAEHDDIGGSGGGGRRGVGGGGGGFGHLSEELKKMLFDFTIECLIEDPVDLVDFGVEFFDRLRTFRQGGCMGVNRHGGGGGGGGGGGDIFEDSLDDDSSDDDDDDDYANGGDDDDDDSDTRDYRSTADAGRRPRRYRWRHRTLLGEPSYELAAKQNDDESRMPQSLSSSPLMSEEKRQALVASMWDVYVFRTLDAEQMDRVINAMYARNVRKGDVVIQQGDDGNEFYVVDTGTYEARVADAHAPNGQRLVRTYVDEGSFGELALLYNTPRAATVVAVTDGTLWVVDRRTFSRIVRQTAIERRDTYERLISAVPMLQSLEPYERMNLADALQPRYYPDNYCIVSQGDLSDGMYFVEQGTVGVFAIDETTGQRARLATIEKHGYFGELALITHKGRAASVFAEGNVKLAFLDVGAFERLLGPCINIMKRNIKNYEEQMNSIFGRGSRKTDRTSRSDRT